MGLGARKGAQALKAVKGAEALKGVNMQNIILNPFAPAAYEGVVTPGSDFVDQDKTYVFDYTLAANEVLTNGTKTLDRDADFVLLGIQITRATSTSFTVQFFDTNGTNMSDNPISALAYFIGSQSLPFPIVPGRMFPAGGNIGIRLTDTSGAPNTVQIIFRGVKRYMVSR